MELKDHPLFGSTFHPFSEEFKEFLERKNDGAALLQKIGFDPYDIKAKSIRAAIRGDMEECLRLFAWRAAFVPLCEEVLEHELVEKRHVEDVIYHNPHYRARFDARRALIEKSLSGGLKAYTCYSFNPATNLKSYVRAASAREYEPSLDSFDMSPNPDEFLILDEGYEDYVVTEVVCGG